MTATSVHPLTMLTPDEVRAATALVRADGRFEDGSLFVHVRLYEPAKDDGAGTAEREVEALLVPPGARLETVEVVVSLTAGTVRSWDVIDGMRPALLFSESG